jgi:hypothetical protein
MDVEQICVPDSVALAGGVAVGWLAELYAADSSLAARLNPLGIVSQETLVDSEILAETSDIMFWLWPNMGPRNYTSAFVAYYGESLGDGSYGVNDLCFSQDVKEEGIFGALFNAPFADFGTAGDWIGDFIVCGEVTDSCQWYGIYRTPK